MKWRTLWLWSLLNSLSPRYFRKWRAIQIRHTLRWWEPFTFFGGLVFYCSICSLTISNPLPFMFFAWSLVGIIPAVGISGLINNIRERGYYDLIAVTPPGASELQWGLASHFIRNNPLFNALCRFLLIGQIFFFCAGFFSGLIYGIDSIVALLEGRPIYESYLLFAAICLLTAFFLRADYMYSIVIGALVGVLMPTYSIHRINASLIAGALFVAIQLVTVILLSGVWSMIEGVDIDEAFGFPFFIGCYIILREVTVRGLWRVNMDETV